MKKIFLFIVLAITLAVSTNAQRPGNNYTRDWQRIDSLSTKAGLTKTALTAVKKIYSAAAAEKNQLQLLKALIYQVLLESNLEEDASLNAIQLLEKQLPVL